LNPDGIFADHTEQNEHGRNHGLNLIETPRIKLVAKSFILRVHEISAKDSRYTPASGSDADYYSPRPP
jgi:hypothetical protein